ncbi:tyrosine-type recombinase/integrase [Myxococcus stipitatus]|uniref:tyrosine-type recombinase/integrase n=1 Tax=Myxococcus stipitatus TaxID=83455 RepID=UPI003CD02995
MRTRRRPATKRCVCYCRSYSLESGRRQGIRWPESCGDERASSGSPPSNPGGGGLYRPARFPYRSTSLEKQGALKASVWLDAPTRGKSILRQHVQQAIHRGPSLRGHRISPHVLRHMLAMNLLRGGVDRTVVALWLGHESVTSTDVNFHVDVGLKERAIEKVGVFRGKP